MKRKSALLATALGQVDSESRFPNAEKTHFLSEDVGAGEAIYDLDCQDIDPNPYQNRRDFDESGIDELKAQIDENGQAQAIAVRRHGKRYQIIFGERRWHSVQRIPGLKIKAVIREATDLEMAYLCGTENAGRRKTHDYERFLLVMTLIKMKADPDDIRRRLVIAYDVYQKLIKFAELPPEVHAHLEKHPGTLGRNDAQTLSTIINSLKDNSKFNEMMQMLIELMDKFVAKEIKSREELINKIKSAFSPPKTRNRKKENVEQSISVGGLKVGSLVKTPHELRLTVSKEQLPEDDYKKLMSLIEGFFSVEEVEET